jgi:hypothetical protein
MVLSLARNYSNYYLQQIKAPICTTINKTLKLPENARPDLIRKM